MEKEKPANKYRVRPGGMMRCCVDSLRENETPSKEGDVVKCKWCEYGSMLKKGAWQIIIPRRGSK